MTGDLPTVRLLHASDIHLGCGAAHPSGFAHQNPCLCSLVATLEAAQHEGVDVIVLAGDVFDHARIGMGLLEQAANAISECAIPCVVLPGNHDPAGGDSLYRRADLQALAPNLTVLMDPEGQMVELLAGALWIWGRPIVVHEPENRPLQSPPARPATGWYVALAHGHYVPEPSGSDMTSRLVRSSPITQSDLASTHADYVALGHWDIPTQVSSDDVVAWYSGSPAVRKDGGSVLSVTLDVVTGVTIREISIDLSGRSCVNAGGKT